jgi:hypothetical protein
VPPNVLLVDYWLIRRMPPLERAALATAMATAQSAHRVPSVDRCFKAHD